MASPSQRRRRQMMMNKKMNKNKKKKLKREKPFMAPSIIQFCNESLDVPVVADLKELDELEDKTLFGIDDIKLIGNVYFKFPNDDVNDASCGIYYNIDCEKIELGWITVHENCFSTTCLNSPKFKQKLDDLHALKDEYKRNGHSSIKNYYDSNENKFIDFTIKWCIKGTKYHGSSAITLRPNCGVYSQEYILEIINLLLTKKNGMSLKDVCFLY